LVRENMYLRVFDTVIGKGHIMIAVPTEQGQLSISQSGEKTKAFMEKLSA